jgi:hypothetical protein
VCGLLSADGWLSGVFGLAGVADFFGAVLAPGVVEVAGDLGFALVPLEAVEAAPLAGFAEPDVGGKSVIVFGFAAPVVGFDVEGLAAAAPAGFVAVAFPAAPGFAVRVVPAAPG